MDITVDRASLLRELQLCASVVEKRNVIPILSHVLLESNDGQLAIRATDLSLTLVTSCVATVRQPGGCAVDSALLIEVARSVSTEEVTLQFADGQLQLHVQCGVSKFDIPSRDRDDYPSMPDLDEATPREIGGDALASILLATAYTITDSEAKFGLIGPVLKFRRDRVTAYGTDGHRLAIAESVLVSRGEDSQGLIPRKAVAAVTKTFGGCETVSFAFGDNNAVLRGGGRTLIVRRHDYSIIDLDGWRKLLKFSDPATITRADLLAAVRRSLIAAPERTRALRFDLTRGRVGVSSMSAERGAASDTIPADYSGDDVTVHFNGTYIVDALESFDDETLCVTPFCHPKSGWSFRPVNEPDDGERFALVMTMTM